MPAQTSYSQTDEQRDLRNVMLFSMFSALVFGLMGLIGERTGILQIPLLANMATVLIGLILAGIGLICMRLGLPTPQVASGTLLGWTFIITAAVHNTGGPQTPMPALYVLVAVAASFLISRQGALMIAAVSVLSYALILALEYSQILSIVEIWRMPFTLRGREVLLIVNLLTVAVPTLGAALLAGTLAERLAERNRQSNELRQQALERLASVQQTNQQLRALQISLSTFQSVLDLDETFKRIGMAVCGLGYTVAYLATFDEQADCLIVHPPVTTLPAETMRATEALMGRAFAGAAFTRADTLNIGVRSFLSGKALVSQDLNDFYNPLVTPDIARAIAQMTKFGSGASLPLRVEGRLVGNLYALTMRPSLAEADLNLLQAFADQASVALERAQLFAEVRLGRDQLQAVLNSTRDGVMMVNQDGQLVTINPATLEMLGLDQDRLQGAALSDVLAHLGQQAGLDAENIASLQTEYVNQCNATLRRTFELAGPPHRFLELLCWPVSAQEEGARSQLVVLHDVTHQKELEASREEFTHMLVHDLRGPLSNVIAGMYLTKEMVKSNELDTASQSIDLAVDGAERLLELINSLLDVYKLEAGRMQLDIAPTDLTRVMAESAKAFESSAQSDQIALVLDAPPDLATVPADASAIQRVLSNLIDNALKFTPPGGQVTVWAKQVHAAIRVGIADTGPGIPADVRAHIFEKFSQVAGRKGKRRGTGLGLAFCKLAVEAHGGRIWVDCPPGGGSVFTFELPLNPKEQTS